MGNKILLGLHDITLSLTSDSDEFISYARANLPSVVLADGLDPNIEVRLRWDAEFSPYQMDRLSRRILIGDTEVVQTQVLSFPGLQLRYSKTGQKIIFEAAYKHPKRRLSFLMKFYLHPFFTT